jgi:hypothetical protein
MKQKILIEIDAGKDFCYHCEFLTREFTYHRTIMGSTIVTPHIACRVYKTVKGKPRILRLCKDKPKRCLQCKRNDFE